MKIRVVYNKLIPFSGFFAMCIWPFIFVRTGTTRKYTTTVDNHERIHAEQQKEMFLAGVAFTVIGLLAGLGIWAILLIPSFFVWYMAEWMCKAFWYGDNNVAYRCISFEREAYANQGNLDYLRVRKHFAWVKYIFHNHIIK